MKQKLEWKREGKNKEEYAREDLVGEADFEIDKEAFAGPFTCHGKKTKLANKRISFKGIEFHYSVWHCTSCKKEYLDTKQGTLLEKFWLIKRLFEDKCISIERNMNYDGRTYFFRFPKELTKTLHKNDIVDIKLLNPDGKLFLVEIKSAKGN
ncbi:MAG TPA: hypothetical protein VJC16_04070 [Candidatus Nanoarchaeia archaeon]|nr:hypothetical protein [Candidatus Nanoarchaeia archaeon]